MHELLQLHYQKVISQYLMKEPLTKSGNSRFQSVIGSLLYIMLGTCPDIAYAVTHLSQFSANPSKEYLDKTLYICCYLAGTRDYALIYDGTSDQRLEGYTDADWGSNPTTRHPTTGFFFTEGNNNPADMFTKNLSHTKFSMLRKTLGLEFYSA